MYCVQIKFLHHSRQSLLTVGPGQITHSLSLILAIASFITEILGTGYQGYWVLDEWDTGYWITVLNNLVSSTQYQGY